MDNSQPLSSDQLNPHKLDLSYAYHPISPRSNSCDQWSQISKRSSNDSHLHNQSISSRYSISRNCFASSIANRMDSGVGICFSCLLGDAPLRPTFPLIFLCHLCTSLLIVTSSRRSALVAPIAESDGHVT